MKLSDIGRVMWAYERWKEQTNIDLVSWREELNPEAVIVMTLDERRELVRLCLKKIFAEIEKAGTPFDRMDRQIIDEDIETFIKREGL